MKRKYLFTPHRAGKVISRRMGLTGSIDGFAAYSTDAPPVAKTPEQEKQELLTAIQNQTIDMINTRGFVNKADADRMIAEKIKPLDGLDIDALRAYKENIGTLQESIKKQGELIASLEEKAKNNGDSQPMTKQSIAANIRAYQEKNKQAWEDFKNHKTNSFGADGNGSLIEVETRAAVTMTVAGSVGSGVYLPGVEMVPGVVQIAAARTFIEQYANTSNTSRSHIIWTEKYNRQGNAAFIGEGELKPLISFEFRTMETYAKKVADKIKVSTEMLEDVEFVAGEIESELRYQVDIAVDTELLVGTGDGTANATGLKGLDAYIGGYSLTTVSTTTPNNFDAIRAAAAQVVSMNFIPTTFFYNSIDGANMDITKDANGRPIAKEYTDASGRIYRMQPVETNRIPQGSLLVGDMSRFKVRNYKPFSISYGWVNDDFELNLVTVIGERRLHAFVAANDVGAFVYDTFDNIKTAILAAVPAP